MGAGDGKEGTGSARATQLLQIGAGDKASHAKTHHGKARRVGQLRIDIVRQFPGQIGNAVPRIRRF